MVTVPAAIRCTCLAGPVMLCLSLFGCAHYRPHPLTNEAVSDRLRPPDWQLVRMKAADLRHPLLRPVKLRRGEGLSPDAAAVLAVLLNPSLVAERDRRGIAAAQLLQAGLLPNPQLSANLDKVIGGAGAPDAHTAYGFGIGMDLQALLQRGAKRAAAEANAKSVDLDIAWKEWQVAEAAKLATYQLIADRQQLAIARAIDERLSRQLGVLRKAVNEHYRTIVDLTTAESARQDAHATALGLEQAVRSDELALDRAIGLPARTPILLKQGLDLPMQLNLPAIDDLDASIETTRLDLLALKRGYESQEQKVRAAILGQFPKLSLTVNAASDNTQVRTVGPSLTMGLPIFDRNQGAIASERATRQQLFDEFVNRVFDARAEIARQVANAGALADQIIAAKAAVGALQRQVSTYRIAANEHNLDAFSYYSALNSLNQKRLQVLKLQSELVAAQIALELATGRYLSE